MNFRKFIREKGEVGHSAPPKADRKRRGAGGIETDSPCCHSRQSDGHALPKFLPPPLQICPVDPVELHVHGAKRSIVLSKSKPWNMLLWKWSRLFLSRKRPGWCSRRYSPAATRKPAVPTAG